VSSEEKKLKKKLQRIKNAKQNLIFQHAEIHERNRELDREREENMRETAKKSSRGAANSKVEGPVWSAKMQEIRSKITGKKRMAEDRWNRFAGTEDSGGMGR
jgi:uncharacterized protein (DUF3084 family)